MADFIGSRLSALAECKIATGLGFEFAACAGKMNLRKWIGVLAAAAGLAAATSASAQDGYEVIERGSPVRWHLWASEGPSWISSGGQTYLGNRFRLGAEAHLGSQNRWILGITVLDALSSGETSTDVGDISRLGADLTAGCFVVPNKLWLAYSLHFEDVGGGNITGRSEALGHQLSAGYRFFTHDNFNLALELAWLHVNSDTITVFDLAGNAFGSATYPSANVWSVSLRAGFDFKG